MSCCLFDGFRLAHRMSGCSSSQVPFAHFIFFLMSFKISLFADSTWPLVWGRDTELSRIWMLNLSQYSIVEPSGALLEYFCLTLILEKRLIWQVFDLWFRPCLWSVDGIDHEVMLGLGSTYQIISRAADVSAELASFATESTCAFWDLGMWTNVNLSNFLINSRTCCKYMFTLSSLVSNFSFTCPTINWESEKVDKDLGPAS